MLIGLLCSALPAQAFDEAVLAYRVELNDAESSISLRSGGSLALLETLIRETAKGRGLLPVADEELTDRMRPQYFLVVILTPVFSDPFLSLSLSWQLTTDKSGFRYFEKRSDLEANCRKFRACAEKALEPALPKMRSQLFDRLAKAISAHHSWKDRERAQALVDPKAPRAKREKERMERLAVQWQSSARSAIENPGRAYDGAAGPSGANSLQGLSFSGSSGRGAPAAWKIKNSVGVPRTVKTKEVPVLKNLSRSQGKFEAHLAAARILDQNEDDLKKDSWWARKAGLLTRSGVRLKDWAQGRGLGLSRDVPVTRDLHEYALSMENASERTAKWMEEKKLAGVGNFASEAVRAVGKTGGLIVLPQALAVSMTSSLGGTFQGDAEDARNLSDMTMAFSQGAMGAAPASAVRPGLALAAQAADRGLSGFYGLQTARECSEKELTMGQSVSCGGRLALAGLGLRGNPFRSEAPSALFKAAAAKGGIATAEGADVLARTARNTRQAKGSYLKAVRASPSRSRSVLQSAQENLAMVDRLAQGKASFLEKMRIRRELARLPREQRELLKNYEKVSRDLAEIEKLSKNPAQAFERGQRLGQYERGWTSLSNPSGLPVIPLDSSGAREAISRERKNLHRLLDSLDSLPNTRMSKDVSKPLEDRLAALSNLDKHFELFRELGKDRELVQAIVDSASASKWIRENPGVNSGIVDDIMRFLPDKKPSQAALRDTVSLLARRGLGKGTFPSLQSLDPSAAGEIYRDSMHLPFISYLDEMDRAAAAKKGRVIETPGGRQALRRQITGDCAIRAACNMDRTLVSQLGQDVGSQRPIRLKAREFNPDVDIVASDRAKQASIRLAKEMKEGKNIQKAAKEYDEALAALQKRMIQNPKKMKTANTLQQVKAHREFARKALEGKAQPGELESLPPISGGSLPWDDIYELMTYVAERRGAKAVRIRRQDARDIMDHLEKGRPVAVGIHAGDGGHVMQIANPRVVRDGGHYKTVFDTIDSNNPRGKLGVISAEDLGQVLIEAYAFVP